MPYIDGKRVPMSEWKKAHPLKAISFEGEEPEDETPEEEAPEADKAPRRTRTKRQQVKAAIAAATGVQVTSLDDELAPLDDDPGVIDDEVVDEPA